MQPDTLKQRKGSHLPKVAKQGSGRYTARLDHMVGGKNKQKNKKPPLLLVEAAQYQEGLVVLLCHFIVET